jgi:hypothetical protein
MRKKIYHTVRTVSSRFPCLMMFESFTITTRGVTCGAGTAIFRSSHPDFRGIRVARSLIFWSCIVDHCLFFVFFVSYGYCLFFVFSVSYGYCLFFVFFVSYGYCLFFVFFVSYGYCLFFVFFVSYGYCLSFFDL